MRTVVDAITDKAGGTGTLTLLGVGAGVTEVVPWRDVHDRARRTSAVLAGYGVRPGARVGLIGQTSVDLVVALQAVWLAGAAVNLLVPNGPDAHLAAVAVDADLELVVIDDDQHAAGRALAGITKVLSLGELTNAARAAVPATPHRPSPGDLAVLQYTSGSTRTPRGVPVTHGHLAANVDAIKTVLRHDAAHGRTMSWLPLYHDMGLVAFFTMPMSCGCPLVLQPPQAFARRPAAWLEALSRHRITFSGAPNFAYALMTRLLAKGAAPRDLDLSAVRALVSGGEPIDADMMARFTEAAGRYGLDPAALMPAYGLAEATLAATVTPVGRGLLVDRIDPDALQTAGRAVAVPPDERGRHLVRVGPPVHGTSVRVVDRVSAAPVAERTVGLVEVRGPGVVGHYWPDPAPPPATWLATGDLGYLVDGELVVCGREKDVLFAAGRNVYPQDVEAVATEAPDVRPGGAAAFGVEGALGDRLVVAVESTGDPASVREGVAEAVLREVGLAVSDVIVVAPGRLPKTSSGKLRRAETRRRYLASEFDRVLEEA